MHSVSQFHMIRRSLLISPPECIAIVQPAGNPVWIMLQLGMDTSHIPTGLEYTIGVQLGIDQGIWMASPEC